MIYFEKIRFKNFLSVGNVFTEIQLDDSKFKLFVGRNGHGKSTLIDALCYVLFKSAFRDINLPQLVNTKNGKQMLVEIWFRVGKKNYRVVRGEKPKVFEIYENDVLLSQDAASRDYQDVLLQILGMDFNSFKQVVVLGSRSYVPFMKLKAADRRAVIEDLLDLKVFTAMNLVLKTKADQTKKALEQCDIDTRWCNDNISLEQNKKTFLTTTNSDRIKELEDRFIETDAKLVEKKAEYVTLQKEIAELKESITDEESVRTSYKQHQFHDDRLQSKMEAGYEEINFFANHDNCPTCKQIIGEEFKAETVKTAEEAMTENTKKQIILEKSMTKLADRLSEIDGVNTIINHKTLKIAVGDTTILNLHEKLKEISNEINGLKSKNEEIVVDTSVLDEWEEALADLAEQKVQLLQDQEIRKAAALILKDNGIKAQMIKKYVPQINKLINKYLAALDFYVKFELDENFKETLKSRHRDTFSYDSFSEGQKMRIDLAILFTWRAIAKKRNSASTNLLIMDEVFESSLDMEGLDDVLKMIQKSVGDSNTIVISPRGDQMHDKFETIYRFELTRDYSKMNKVK